MIWFFFSAQAKRGTPPHSNRVIHKMCKAQWGGKLIRLYWGSCALPSAEKLALIIKVFKKIKNNNNNDEENTKMEVIIQRGRQTNKWKPTRNACRIHNMQQDLILSMRWLRTRPSYALVPPLWTSRTFTLDMIKKCKQLS